MIMETVAFYSYKGGVGRTLLVANTAQFLALSGRRVVALDLDLEAPGLHHKLGNPDVKMLRGAVDELLGVIEGEHNRSLRDTAIEVHLPSGTGGSLFLIPAGAAPSPAYWAALERLNQTLRTHRRNGGLPEAVLELQARIAEEFDADFLLIDSRTGITELGGLATSLLADRVVCLTSTSPESVEGIRVVAEALRAAPRLASQKPLRLEFLVTRFESGLVHALSISQELGDGVTILHHDPGIAYEEQVWHRPRPLDSEGPGDPGMILFDDTLSWIGKSFPGHEQQTERARRRMRAVYRSWQDLAKGSGPSLNLLADTVVWLPSQLRERVRFGEAENSRRADIVACLGSTACMIVEYVDTGEDPDTVARWWFAETQVPVVALLGDDPAPRLYSRKGVLNSTVRPSARRDLPQPGDFDALPDPTDVSVGSLLDAVRRGHPEYLERIVDEWAIGEAVAPDVVDGLARLDDVELARQALTSTAGQGGTGLFAPLFWRLPPEASIPITQKGWPVAAVSETIALLAQDVLGLHYDSTTPISLGLSGDVPPLGRPDKPQPGRVVLYSQAISQLADQLALRARHVGSVTLIHQTLRELAHTGRDLDGCMWPEFDLPAEIAPIFETLIQYFTYRHLVRLRDSDLLHAFETMSDQQAPFQREWKRLRNLFLEDARSWLMSVRRGGVSSREWQEWYDALPDEN
jgi:MinD-like ATPase involved in chromosome partitioning or flagellar assembly